MAAHQRTLNRRQSARSCARPESCAAGVSAGSAAETVVTGQGRSTITTVLPGAGLACRLRVFALRAARSDSGLSLMELVVGLVIMTIFMTMFTGATMMMYNASSKSEALADTASQLSIAFNRLDSSVRYASAISTPGQSGDDWYVEWLSTYNGDKECTQVRLAATVGQLQERTWSVADDGTAIDVTSWLPLASGLEQVDSATSPFSLSLASDAVRNDALPYQQLTFDLLATSTGRTGVTTTASDITFTAFNSQLLTTGPVCAEEGRG